MSLRTFATTALLAGSAFGSAFTTIDPCPSAPKNLTQLHQSITVTGQHQPVSTCTRDSASFGWSSYKWVSTVIPCWGESSISSCTVTDTAQVVPCTGTSKTITSVVPTSTARANGTYSSYNVTKYQTVSKLWVAPYNEIGPLAIPGYAGCELCTTCGPQQDGGKKQNFEVTECTSASGVAPVCSQYVDTWYSSAVPSTTGAVTAAISTKTAVPSGGVYTWYFPQPAPSTTIRSQQQWYTVPAQPWTASVTKSFSGPTNYDIIVTVTKTVTFNVPYSTDPNPQKTPAPQGFKHQGWGAWSSADPKTTSTTAALPTGWAEWQSFGQSQGLSTATPAQTARPWDPQGDKSASGASWAAWASKTADSTTTTVYLTTFSTKTSSSTQYSTTATLTTSASSSGTTSSTSTISGSSSTTTGSESATSWSTSTTVSESTTSWSTSTTASSTTSPYTTSTTTSSGTPEETNGFYIEVTFTGLRRRYTKRGDATYLGFLDGSDDASVVTSSQGPAKFFFDAAGYLLTGTQWIASDSSSGYFIFERTNQKPASPPPYALSGGVFTRSGPGSFCATSSNFFISINSSPSDCKPVTCKSNQDPAAQVTTTASTTTTSAYESSSTTYTTTTTTQADVSADLAVPDPTPFVRRGAKYL